MTSLTSTATPLFIDILCPLKLLEQNAVGLNHGVLGDAITESGKGGVIRSRMFQWNAEKIFKREAIVDLAFEFGIRMNLKPLLKEQALEQHQRRIGVASFTGLSDRIMPEDQFVDRVPVNGIIQLFQEEKCTVIFAVLFNGQIVVFNFFECRRVFLLFGIFEKTMVYFIYKIKYINNKLVEVDKQICSVLSAKANRQVAEVHVR